MTMTAITPSDKVKARILTQVSVGGTSVLLDWNSARALLDDLKRQLETFEVIRLNVNCVSSSSKIVNLPLMVHETRSLIETLEWFVYD